MRFCAWAGHFGHTGRVNRWSEYAVHFQEPEPTRRTKVRDQLTWLSAASVAVLQGIGRELECIRCHDAHGEVATAPRFASVRKQSCVSCHQPSSGTGSQRMLYLSYAEATGTRRTTVSMTDHRIGVRPPAATAEATARTPRDRAAGCNRRAGFVSRTGLTCGEASTLGLGIEHLRRVPSLPEGSKARTDRSKRARARTPLLPPPQRRNSPSVKHFAERAGCREAEAHLRRALPLAKAKMALGVHRSARRQHGRSRGVVAERDGEFAG
jgi:hypothetical protein